MKKKELMVLLFVTLIGILLPVGASIRTTLGLFSIFFPLPFVILGARFCKYKSISLGLFVASVLIIISLTELQFAMDINFSYIIPGFFLGILINWVNNVDKQKRAIPFLYGLLIFFVGMVVYYIFERLAFGKDAIREIHSFLQDIIKETSRINKNTYNLINASPEEVIDLYMEILPALAIMRAMFLSLLSYYLGNRLLVNIYPSSYQAIDFKKFALPDKSVFYWMGFYFLIMIIGYFYKDLKQEAISKNIQMVFMGLFAIQGFSLLLHLIGKSKLTMVMRIVIVVLTLIVTGFFGLSIVGIIDNIFNFRKLESTS